MQALKALFNLSKETIKMIIAAVTSVIEAVIDLINMIKDHKKEV